MWRHHLRRCVGIFDWCSSEQLCYSELLCNFPFICNELSSHSNQMFDFTLVLVQHHWNSNINALWIFTNGQPCFLKSSCNKVLDSGQQHQKTLQDAFNESSEHSSDLDLELTRDAKDLLLWSPEDGLYIEDNTPLQANWFLWFYTVLILFPLAGLQKHVWENIFYPNLAGSWQVWYGVHPNSGISFIIHSYYVLIPYPIAGLQYMHGKTFSTQM